MGHIRHRRANVLPGFRRRPGTRLCRAAPCILKAGAPLDDCVPEINSVRNALTHAPFQGGLWTLVTGQHRDVAAIDDGNSATPSAVRTIEPTLDAAALARRFVRDNRDHLDPDVVANAELLVSELVTNAVLHGAGAITLQLPFDPPGLVVAVTDTGDRLPVVSAPPPTDQSSGRGLLIVDALSSEWGVEQRQPPPGKTVWFGVRPRSK